ncbi:cytochrome P450 [Aaosphaeria arxii CBS 175.79]|uniref:Cytochrome P450 n=1 Tax=Aaosphaeria arxii CBS 175.79 TaxID=1450172 RepID=A0A6A5XMK7_9PLEO|nr:cytochrome P450 [Aaosphaeria arxii CBS 175.79]KAF2014077.1 cytochrome P450 [Aaosphaeria arxii CBS 175.79]
MPQHSKLAGHLFVLKKHMDHFPPDCTINTPFTEMARQFPGGMFYFDLWPFTKPILFVNNPFGALQWQQALFDKPSEIRDAFSNLTGGPNIFTMKEKPWKYWRAVFNPGFSAAHILELVPMIVTETETFCQILEDQSKHVISAVTLETRLHYQTSENKFASDLRRQIEWTSFGSELNPFDRYNVFRPLILWINSRRIHKFLHAEITKRYAALGIDKGLQHRSHKLNSIMTLVLSNFIKENEQAPQRISLSEFTNVAAAQLRLFLFAGHDTTSSTLIYSYHLLATHPESLARVRAEMNEVLGPAAKTPALLRERPALLNQLPYTLAVIKETLRLFPPASGFREGKSDVSIFDEDGTAYPTDGCYVWVVHLALQRDPKYWKDPHSFIPERWLVGPGDPLYPVKGAWRPFEFGPQNCLGQSLALVEIKVVLAMTIRSFDIQPAYEEWDEIHKITRTRTVYGNRAYQVEGGGGGAHPSERYPCTVQTVL